MNRTEKETVVAELHDTFGRASVALIATNKGLSVGESTELRRIIRAAGGEMRVAKHTLTRLALADTRFGDLGQFLEGPRGLVFGFDDPIGIAKLLVDFANIHKKLEIDGGALEGQVMGAAGVENLAKMPDLPTLQSRLAQQVLSPASRLASQMASPATRIAGAIAARVTQLEEGSEAPAAEASAETGADAAPPAEAAPAEAVPAEAAPAEAAPAEAAAGGEVIAEAAPADEAQGEAPPDEPKQGGEES